ncbi:unnamed protein product, partial [Symbiodinium microadriaticum]
MSSRDGTPTPTTIRQVVRAPMAPVWGTEVLALKANRHSCESTDGSFVVGTEDLSSFEGEESDEKLLALLGDLALGAEEVEEDPAARVLLDECGALWEEVHMEAEAQREMQCRLRRELQHLQDRSHWQHAESGAFLQRLSVAREALADKIREATDENEALRQKLRRHHTEEERLRCGLAEDLRCLDARAAELRAAIFETGQSQAELVERLRAVTNTQAHLQAELQQERVKTWRQSSDVVMAFAGGKDGRELEREEAERLLLESQLTEVASRAAATGIPRLCDEEPEVAEAVLAAADTVPFATLQGQLDSFEELRGALEALEGSCALSTAQQKEEEEKLGAEQLELSRLAAEMATAEAAAQGPELDQASSLVSVLCGELQSEQAVLRQEREAAARRRELFRSQVEQKRRELARLQAQLLERHGESQVDWRLGFALLLAYFFITVGFAVNVDEEPRLAKGRSAAWVLVCCQVLFLGSWLASGGEVFEAAGYAEAGSPPDTSHVVFGGQLYFSSSDLHGRLLMQSNGTSVAPVPPGVRDAHGFRELDGRLMFFGVPQMPLGLFSCIAPDGHVDSGESVWAISASCDADAELLRGPFQETLRWTTAQDLVFKAAGTCGPFRKETLYSNLSLVGQNLPPDCDDLAAGLEPRPSTSRLLGVLFLGVLPQTGLGAYLLIRKQVPGAFVSVFVGAYAMVLLIHLLMQGHLVNLLFFLQASSLTYTASSCIAVAANQVAWQRGSGFVVALGDWASGASALGLASALALALPELPAAAAACVFLVLAPFLKSAIPAQLAFLGLLLLCSKVGAAWDGPWGRGLPDFHLPLAFYLLSVLVLLGEEAYASQRPSLEAWLQLAPNAPGPDPPESSAEVAEADSGMAE